MLSLFCSYMSTELGLFTYEQMNGHSIRDKYPWMKECDFKLVKSIEELKDLIDQAIATGLCSLDLESSGLDTRVYDGVCNSFITGFSFCFDGKTGYYVPINHGVETETGKFIRKKEWNLDVAATQILIQKLIDNCILIFHNCLYDHEIMQQWGYNIRKFVAGSEGKGNKIAFHDTLIMARLHDASSKQIGLKFLSEHFLRRKMLELDGDVFAKGEDIKFHTLDPNDDITVVYAASDAICTFGLYPIFKHIEGEQGIIYNIERQVTFAVRQMERNRVCIDVDKLREYKVDLDDLRIRIEREANELVGDPINLSSPKQVGDILVNKYSLRELVDPIEKDQKTGEFKIHTDSEYLEKYKDQYPLIRLILMHRDITKTMGTYIENLLETDRNNEVKFQFIPTRTDTGRFASPGGKPGSGFNGTNIQAMTKPTDAKKTKGLTIDQIVEQFGSGFFLRSTIKARPGYKLAAIDYSGEELRVAANVSKEPLWIKEFLEGDQDLHTITARAIFGVEKPDKDQRGLAKTCNFQTLYGGGPKALAEKANIPVQEAKKHQQRMMGGLKQLKAWIEKEKADAKARGYALTPFGRRRPLNIVDPKDFKEVSRAERLATNTPIQGAGGDIMKLAMVRTHDYCMKHPDEVRMLITIHDELVFEVKEDLLSTHLPALMNLMSLEEILKNKMGWKVPLSMDCEVGDSWNVEYEYFEENPQDIAKLNADLRDMKARQFNLDKVTLQPLKSDEKPVESKKEEFLAIEETPAPKKSFNDTALAAAMKAFAEHVQKNDIPVEGEPPVQLDPVLMEGAFKEGLSKYLELCPGMISDDEKEMTGGELHLQVQKAPFSWKKYVYVMQSESMTEDKMMLVEYLINICKGGNNSFVFKSKIGEVLWDESKINAVKFDILASYFNI